jgi:predicted transposase YdaD
MQRALEALVMERQTEGKATFPPFIQQLIDRGEAKGRAEGETSAHAHAVLTVLQARGIAVPDAARERILSESDLARLERWLKKAAVAALIAEVLDEPS